jgi:hypothetical protein
VPGHVGDMQVDPNARSAPRTHLICTVVGPLRALVGLVQPNGTNSVLDNDWPAGLVVTDGEHGQGVQPLGTCLMDGGLVGD